MPKPLQASNKQTTQIQKNDGRQSNANGTGSGAATMYEEAQADELEALKSIFMEDFEEVKTKSAWSRHSEKSFKLRLRAYSDTAVAATLSVTLTATYPKTLPLLHIENVTGVRHAFTERLHNSILVKPKEMTGEVMIHEVATTIQDILEDSASAQARDSQLPSLEEERATQEAAATRAALEEEAREAKRSEEVEKEEERVLARLVNEEVKRRQDSKPKRDIESADHNVQSKLSHSQVVFDHDVQIKDSQGFDASFRIVTIMSKLHSGQVTDVFSVCPDLSEPAAISLALKRSSVQKSKLKKPILDLEKQLEMLKTIRHSNTVNVIDFRIESETDSWRFDILTDFANLGSLADLLSLSDTLSLSKVRTFSIELLQALDHYHKSGIIHGDLHLANVLLHKSTSGNPVVMLADAGFQAELKELKFAGKWKRPKNVALLDAWTAPELLANDQGEKSRKTDIWDFGVILLQMLFGRSITAESKSWRAFANSAALSQPLDDLVRNIFNSDSRKRSSAFDLIPHEFFRTNAPATDHLTLADSGADSLSGSHVQALRRPRHDSFAAPKAASRYTREWDEAGRLGKGGYGEVVKARNKVDGRVYAIKKVTKKSQSELSQVLSEVYLLATLNHPYVVRYYTAWPEDEESPEADISGTMTSSGEDGLFSTGELASSIDFGPSAGGLDFISSSGFPKIDFAEDDNGDEGEGDSDDDESVDSSEASTQDDSHSAAIDAHAKTKPWRANLGLQRSGSDSRVMKSTLYIQMEFCERHNLRDMIRKGMHDNWDNVWQIFRQILEGLSHIHSHGIIHRDLKPENIFMDVTNNPKIGDFGLATSGQYQLSDKADSSRGAGDDMTRSIGTTLYVAPEAKSDTGVNYTDKVDMYSLGIIFFEMCFPIGTAMERIQVLRNLREKDHVLPNELRAPDCAVQGEIIESLIKHKPSERPSSVELLRSGKIPVQMEDETIRLALRSLTDENSPYYYKVMSALFSNGLNREIRDHLWDIGANHCNHASTPNFPVFQNAVRDKLADVFRRHGSVETQRQMLFPRSDYYANGNIVQFLDPSGTLLQLPFDLTLPNARAIARQEHIPQKSFTFGTVFRNSKSGGAPQRNREVDFDIASREGRDGAMMEAEVLKVMDEILDEFPSFSSTNMSFHISHGDILEIIMDFCRIPKPQRSPVKEIVGKLNIQEWTWQKVRSELRAPSLGISASSLDEMAQFDFRETPGKCYAKLQSIMANSGHLRRIQEIFTHVSGFEEYCKRFGIHRKIFFSPLSSFNHQFYEGGIMFQCIYDGKKKDVLAAGGRYDHLVKQHRPRLTEKPTTPYTHAVGINIAWDRLVNSMLRYLKHTGNSFLKKTDDVESRGQWTARRCDVLVASFDMAVLRSVGVRMVADLWRHDISAEIAGDAESTEDLLSNYRNDQHSWIIIIKHDDSAGSKPDLKVKSMDKKEDFDVRRPELISFMKGEIRDRDQREGTNDRAKIYRQPSHQEHSTVDSQRNVQVLTPSHRNKKTNKWRIVESAQEKAGELVQSFTDNPIASIDTRDSVLEMIQDTRLSDPESWRKVIHAVPLSERKYLQDVQAMISTFKSQYEDKTRYCFIYNFRSGTCILYDLRI